MQKKQNDSGEISEKNPQQNIGLGKSGKDGVLSTHAPERKQAMRDEREEDDTDPVLDERDMAEHHLEGDMTDNFEEER